MNLRNKKWTEAEFFRVRREVLSTWPTGSSPLLDLDKAADYLKSLPVEKNFAVALDTARQKQTTLVQPRAGVATIEGHIALLRYLEAAGADLLPTTIDSYTRLNRYEDAEVGLKESMKLGRSMLNGFPAVNHGVAGCRNVTEAVNVPVEVRHGTPDARLLAEIAFASGFTSFEGGGISYNIPYAKNISVEDTIRYWQYCDRLVGYYEDLGIRLNREPFGPLTGTLVPPAIGNAVAIIEALLAAEQGVKSITVGVGQCGAVVQDIAALRALLDQTEEYLHKFGYDDVSVTTVFHQWMGGFPADEAEALALIAVAAFVAAAGGATKMITKTPQESVGVPTMEANAAGIKASKFVVGLVGDQKLAADEKIKEEYHQVRKEVDCLLKHVLILGHGDIAVGAVEAFREGIIDIPFAPSRFNANRMLPARDNDGCIRILDFGNLGFDEDIKAFHQSKIKERARTEGRDANFQLTVDDINAVSHGRLIGRPHN
jgi:methylaspartate mutase epsilon subunit